MFCKKNIFISHSSNNKDIAEQLCAFISRLGVDENNIFCSSIIGQGVGNGEKLNDAICNAIHNSKLLIYLISCDFINSPYCIEELGVGWYLTQLQKASCFYLILPDIALSELNGFVNSKIDKFSFIDIEHKDDLGLFAVDVAKKLHLRTPNHQMIVNASKTFFSATEQLINEIKTKRENQKAESQIKEREVEILKEELHNKDNTIQTLQENNRINYERIRREQREVEHRTISTHFQLLGFRNGITENQYKTLYKEFWFKMLNRYVELENEINDCNPYMEILLSSIYSANGNYKEAYKRLQLYVKYDCTNIYPSFYENVNIDTSNDMQEIIDILKNKLETEPQGITYDSYQETIKHLEERKQKLAEKFTNKD